VIMIMLRVVEHDVNEDAGCVVIPCLGGRVVVRGTQKKIEKDRCVRRKLFVSHSCAGTAFDFFSCWEKKLDKTFLREWYVLDYFYHLTLVFL